MRMAYKKRTTSPAKEKADNRLSGIQQYEKEFDLGNGLTEAAYIAAIKKVDDLTKENNDLLTKVDGVATALGLAEKALSSLSSRILNGVGSKYTKDSIEYEKAGGVRTSDFKKTKKSSAAKAEKK
jgi:hypothetical protein